MCRAAWRVRHSAAQSQMRAAPHSPRPPEGRATTARHVSTSQSRVVSAMCPLSTVRQPSSIVGQRAGGVCEGNCDPCLERPDPNFCENLRIPDPDSIARRLPPIAMVTLRPGPTAPSSPFSLWTRLTFCWAPLLDVRVVTFGPDDVPPGDPVWSLGKLGSSVFRLGIRQCN